MSAFACRALREPCILEYHWHPGSVLSSQLGQFQSQWVWGSLAHQTLGFMVWCHGGISFSYGWNQAQWVYRPGGSVNVPSKSDACSQFDISSRLLGANPWPDRGYLYHWKHRPCLQWKGMRDLRGFCANWGRCRLTSSLPQAPCSSPSSRSDAWYAPSPRAKPCHTRPIRSLPGSESQNG